MPATRGFGSDNHAGVHPDIFNSLSEANFGHAPSYGTDQLCLKAEAEFRKHFGESAKTFFVFNGTAANTLSLKALTHSHHSILCSDISHANIDECGAPEFFTGCKLIPVKTVDGKMSCEEVKKHLIRRGDQHSSQVRALTITQPTEVGTLYSISELSELCRLAKDNGLYIHIDGARIANAVVSAKSSFKEMFTDNEVDVISFGGTKNGLLFGEAVIFLNPSLGEDFKYIRKQGLNLPSKSRFIGAQFEAYFKNDLWREIASHENEMAQLLYEELKGISAIEISYPVQSNAVFAKIPRAVAKKVRKEFFFYFWDEKTFEARLMCSFDTQPEDIKGFVEVLKKHL